MIQIPPTTHHQSCHNFIAQISQDNIKYVRRSALLSINPQHNIWNEVPLRNEIFTISRMSMSFPLLSMTMQLFTFSFRSFQFHSNHNITPSQKRVNLTFAKMFTLSFPNKNPLSVLLPYHNISQSKEEKQVQSHEQIIYTSFLDV